MADKETDRETGLFLYIKDKQNLEQELYCPPHHWPHKLPFTKPIRRERCHFHAKKWRLLHHIPLCHALRCKNIKTMLKFYKEPQLQTGVVSTPDLPSVT